MSLNNHTSNAGASPLLIDVYCMGAWVQEEPVKESLEQKGEDVFSFPRLISSTFETAVSSPCFPCGYKALLYKLLLKCRRAKLVLQAL